MTSLPAFGVLRRAALIAAALAIRGILVLAAGTAVAAAWPLILAGDGGTLAMLLILVFLAGAFVERDCRRAWW